MIELFCLYCINVNILVVVLYKSESVNSSVMSNSLQPHGLQPARLLCPWDSPGKNTEVGCHLLLQEIFLTEGLNPCLLCLLSPALAVRWEVQEILYSFTKCYQCGKLIKGTQESFLCYFLQLHAILQLSQNKFNFKKFIPTLAINMKKNIPLSILSPG